MQTPAWLDREARRLGVLDASSALPVLDAADVKAALEHPVWPEAGGPTVFDVVRPGERVCFVVSDPTRRTAADVVLPVVVEGLLARGCLADDMAVLVATGIHRAPRPSEIERIIGAEAFALLTGRIHVHNADDAAGLVTVGTTRRGHPVRVNRLAVEARRLIPIGAASYHYHAGFGGGRKSLVPGLASRETIAWNHSLTLDPGADRVHPMAAPGVLDGNPVAEEMLEAARFLKADIIVNTVLDGAGRLVGVFSGDLDAAHRAACRLAARICRVDITETADLVIASAGTAPNWVQSHKALYTAHRAVKPETGRIVLLAPCREGVGDERFRYWLRRPSVEDIYRELRVAPEVNGQTALSTRLRGRQAILVTEMSADDIRDVGIRTAPDLDAALRLALAEVRTPSAPPTYYVMPSAGYTMPFLV